jgi:hypothetical protein
MILNFETEVPRLIRLSAGLERNLTVTWRLLDAAAVHCRIDAALDAANEERDTMNTEPRPAAPAATDKISAKMKLRFHVYPDARSTTRRAYCSAWARRFGRSARA